MKKRIRNLLAAMIAFSIIFSVSASAVSAVDAGNNGSDQQIVEKGDKNVSKDGSVEVSKIISGTEFENVFDITLEVVTHRKVTEFFSIPDIAVMIVLDVSNTMNEDFGDSTRYEAAIASAKKFVDSFLANASEDSLIGVVTFNTNSYQTVALQSCKNETEAGLLKDAIEQGVTAIVTADGYNSSHSRFTNIESGLKRANDQLKNTDNEAKYIIFLSDGFPTTYISSGYDGYDPYCSSGTVGQDGVFYDSVTGKYCTYGTSYSDKAAIKARTEATSIKNNDIQIFPIGIAIGDQTIDNYERPTSSFSIIDRTSTTYEIGSSNDAQAFKNWLKDGIGSGIYYDSTDEESLDAAFTSIFDEIIRQKTERAISLWVASDPIPQIEGNDYIEFIAFHDKNGQLKQSLSGAHEENGENTASFDPLTKEISWDLKKSGYRVITSTTESDTRYIYSVKYRVRLKNENASFIENNPYITNGNTDLSYQYIETVGDKSVISDSTVAFNPIPSVKGYLANLDFLKLGKPEGAEDEAAVALDGVKFVLVHDPETCEVCSKSGINVAIETFEAVSNEDGEVSFKNIPSGHSYILKETEYKERYWSNGDTYSVSVAYDVITVTVTHPDGKTEKWSGVFDSIINLTTPYHVIYVVVPDPDYGVPGDSFVPEDPIIYKYHDDVIVHDDLVTEYGYAIVDDEKVLGYWEFTPWDREDFQIEEDTVITGYWKFVPLPDTGDSTQFITYSVIAEMIILVAIGLVVYQKTHKDLERYYNR